MKVRMSRWVALLGIIFSPASFAQDCEQIYLYQGANERGQVEQSTFPEGPEWSANWGIKDGMKPPYIRLSGQKDELSHWSTLFAFEKLPVTVKGGNFSLKLHATQKARARLWLVGAFGKSEFYEVDLEANKTKDVTVLVETLVGNKTVTVTNVGVALLDVPAYQYTTLFIDDVAFSCIENNPVTSSGLNFVLETSGYEYSSIDFTKAKRESKYLSTTASETSAAFSEEQRKQLQDSTNFDFVVSLLENSQIENFVTATELTPKQSKEGWFKALYLVERNRLRDSVIANPKTLYYEGESFAAGSDFKSSPLLIANVDYGYRICADTTCEKQSIEGGQLLCAGLPLSGVKGSVLQLHYDPYFVTSTRGSLPDLEIYTENNWVKLLPNSSLNVRFSGAGLQEIKVRISEGGKVTNQTLFVEVK